MLNIGGVMGTAEMDGATLGSQTLWFVPRASKRVNTVPTSAVEIS